MNTFAQAIKTTSEDTSIPNAIFTNQRIAVQKSLIFQWVLLTVDDEENVSWDPIEGLPPEVLRMVKEEARDTIFPDALREFLFTLPKKVAA